MLVAGSDGHVVIAQLRRGAFSLARTLLFPWHFETTNPFCFERKQREHTNWKELWVTCLAYDDNLSREVPTT